MPHILAFAVTLTAAVALNAAASLAQAPASQPASAPQVPVVARDAPQVAVIVDPRIELLLIVQHLTGDYEKRTNLITNFDSAYKREIEEHFRPFAMHTVVSTYRAMAKKGFSFDAGPQAVLSLTADEDLAMRAVMPDDLLKRVGGAEKFETFREQLADFAKASGFFEFFREHQPFYDGLCAAVREGTKPEELVKAINDYTGLRVANATLVLFPLGHPGGFAAQITPQRDGRDEPMQVYAVVGPGGVADDKPTWTGAPWFESLVIHEFAHTVVNPLAEKHRDRVAQSADLLKPIKDQMSRQAYQSWETVVNEHIVRTLETRIALQRHGIEAGEAKAKDELRRGFVHLPALVKALEEYERDRQQWKTLDDFYPHLLAVFESAD